VVGVIANLAVWFALRLLFEDTRLVEGMGMALSLPLWASVDPVAVVLCAASAGLLFLTRLGLFGVVGLAAAAGWLVTAGPLPP